MLTQGRSFVGLKQLLLFHCFMLRNIANVDEKIVPINKKEDNTYQKFRGHY
jgi:hypothetical protein